MNKNKNKNKIIIVLLIIILLFSCKFKVKEDMNYTELVENGFVPDEETAGKIADIILCKIYGEEVLLKKPYQIKLIGDTWYIEGTLKNDKFESLSFGGIPYIKIRKSDGAILGVTHTK